MKKSFKSIFILLFASTLLFLGYQIISRINYKEEVQKNIKTIPEFFYSNVNGENFTHNDLKKGTPTLFIYFNTECEYCNEEAKIISKNIVKFKNTEIIFISFENSNQIKQFAQKHKLNHHDNVHFLHDSKPSFAITFDVNALPTIIIYNSQKQLLEKIKGQVKIDHILKKINKQ